MRVESQLVIGKSYIYDVKTVNLDDVLGQTREKHSVDLNGIRRRNVEHFVKLYFGVGLTNKETLHIYTTTTFCLP